MRVSDIVEWVFGEESVPDQIICFADSDWAGEVQTRKSSSGRTVLWGNTLART